MWTRAVVLHKNSRIWSLGRICCVTHLNTGLSADLIAPFSSQDCFPFARSSSQFLSKQLLSKQQNTEPANPNLLRSLHRYRIRQLMQWPWKAPSPRPWQCLQSFLGSGLQNTNTWLEWYTPDYEIGEESHCNEGGGLGGGGGGGTKIYITTAIVNWS